MKIIHNFFLFILTLILFSCSDILRKEQTSIIVNFGDSRTIYTKEHLSYYIISIQPEVQSAKKVGKNGIAEFSEISEGNYTIFVNAYSEDNNLIASGNSPTVNVKSGEVSVVTIKMSPKEIQTQTNPVEPETISISYNSEYGSVQSNLRTLSNGFYTLTEIDFPLLAEEGCSFMGWYLDSSLKNAATIGTKITGNTTLYAQWKKLISPGDIYVLDSESQQIYDTQGVYTVSEGNVYITTTANGNIVIWISIDDESGTNATVLNDTSSNVYQATATSGSTKLYRCAFYDGKGSISEFKAEFPTKKFNESLYSRSVVFSDVIKIESPLKVGIYTITKAFYSAQNSWSDIVTYINNLSTTDETIVAISGEFEVSQSILIPENSKIRIVTTFDTGATLKRATNFTDAFIKQLNSSNLYLGATTSNSGSLTLDGNYKNGNVTSKNAVIYNGDESAITYIHETCTIQNNYNGDVVNSIGNGGGIYANGKLYIAKGTIKDNYTMNDGSGAGIYVSGTCTVTSGSVISGNKYYNEKASNIYGKAGSTLTINGSQNDTTTAVEITEDIS